MAPYAEQVDELRRRYPVPRGALALAAHRARGFWLGIRWRLGMPKCRQYMMEFYTMYRQARRYLALQVCQNVAATFRGQKTSLGI